MEHTTADMVNITLPADDGEIHTALAHLEQRFAEYHSAIRQFHQRMPWQSAADGHVAEPMPPAPALSEDGASTAALEKVTEPVARNAAEADAAPVAALKAETESVRDIAARCSTVAADAEPVVVGSAPSAEPNPVADAGPSDEALLASLDPETAQTIRVMRRLSPVKKSVQEWLEEYKAAQAKTPAAKTEKKKSWFSRGR